MKRNTILLTLGMMIFLAFTAVAQNPNLPQRRGLNQPPNRRARIARQWDLNRDRQITRNEWRGNPAAFDRWDRNGDGMIGRNEAGFWRGRQQGLGLRRLDTNNDGMVTRNEWAGNAVDFDRFDVDKDGILKRGECQYPNCPWGNRRIPRRPNW